MGILNLLGRKGEALHSVHRYCQRVFPVESVCETDDESMKKFVAVAIQEFRKQQEGESSEVYETFAGNN